MRIHQTETERAASRKAAVRRYYDKNRDQILTRTPEQLAQKREYDRQRYRERRAEYIARSSAHYEANREQVIARVTEWAAQDPGRSRQYKRNWKIANPEKARRIAASGSSTHAQVAARVAFFGGVCSYCGGPYEHLDHAIPLSRGGTAWPANLRPACKPCNLSKHARTVQEFAVYRRSR